ncbi:8812_t:CDS:2 [Diversispora eburnea]|uniref:8812_t:CDS:1 n=1 Tax=Diversispora eburnea TaxID=1213867 RepID=A0A9N9AEU9_9GLOM|nr:8812_t:CDS:2 [Diversispora eburnea]
MTYESSSLMPPKSSIFAQKSILKPSSTSNSPILYTSNHPPKSPLLTPKSPLLLPKSPLLPPKSPNLSPNKPRSNPIIGLLDTEEEYVEELTSLIKRIINTTSWKYDNPSPELNVMFRYINDIYKENNDFCSRLGKVDVNPNNPHSIQAIADILMTWDLSSKKNRLVTLDYFFELPLKRIHYYKNLYARLYKSSEPGRSDHELLAKTNQRIDYLIELARESENRPEIRPKIHDTKRNNKIAKNQINNVNNQDNKNWDLMDLESKLDDSRIMDLFTKSSKRLKIKLQPANLPFRRELILHEDFIVILPDANDNSHKAHVKAHLFLFTDMLLICQKLNDEEKRSNPTKEFLILYPPLSGRHLTVLDINDDKEDLFQITVMEKIILVIFSENKGRKNFWIKEIFKMIEFAYNAARNTDTTKKIPPRKDSHPLSNNDNNSPTRSRQNSEDSKRNNFISESTMDTSENDNLFIETLFQSSICNISIWKDNGWRPFTTQDECYIELRLTTEKKCYMMIMSKERKRIIHHIFIGPSPSSIYLQRESPCIINITCEIGPQKDYFNIFLPTPMETDKFLSCVNNFRNSLSSPTSSSSPPSLSSPPSSFPSPTLFNKQTIAKFAPRTSSLQKHQSNDYIKELESMSVMESRCRIFLNNEHAIWTNFGWGKVQVILETPSNKKRIIIILDKQKSKLVDSIIWETGVEKVGKLGIAITINNNNNTSTSRTP